MTNPAPGSRVSDVDSRTLIALLRGCFCPSSRLTFDWDWDTTNKLVAAATWHGVVSLLYRALARDPRVPRPLLEAFRAASCLEATRGCVLAGELFRVCETFREHGIDVLTLKGPAVSMLAHGQPAIRGFCDLDVLVRREDVGRAVRLLAVHGFVATEPYERYMQERDRKDVCLQHASRGIALELHWAFCVPSMRVTPDMPGIWSRAQSVTIAGRDIRTLGPEDTLLYQCIHGTIHGWSRLKWVCDLAALLGAPTGIDWKELLQRASSLGCRRMLVVGAGVAARLFDVSLPPQVNNECARDRCAQMLVQRVSEQLMDAEHMVDTPCDLSHPLEYRERLRDRLVMLGWKLRNKWRTTDADLQAVALPPVFRPLYLLIRPVRLLRKYGLSWVRIVLTGCTAFLPGTFEISSN